MFLSVTSIYVYISISFFLSQKTAFKPIFFRNWIRCSSNMCNRCFLSLLPLDFKHCILASSA